MCSAENSFSAVGAVTAKGVAVGINSVAVAMGAGIEA